MIPDIRLLDSLAAPWIAAIITGIVQGCIATAPVACALKLAKGLNAGTRYLIWWVTLAGTVALLAVNVASVPRDHAVDFQPSKKPVAAIPAPVIPRASRSTPVPTERLLEIPAVRTESPRAVARQAYTPIQIRLQWLPFGVAAIWIAAVLIMFVRIAGGLGLLARLRHGAAPAPLPYSLRLDEMIRDRKLRRRVSLMTSSELRTPVAAGLYRPAIIIPTFLLNELTPSEFDQIAMHELAHIQRLDDWANLIQRMLVALFVFHPAVQFISKQLDLEREIDCDDFVLEQTGRPRDYAACLTRVVEMTGWAHQPSLAPGATIHKSHFVRRIETLLNRRQNARRIISKGVIAAISVMFIFIVVCSAAMPALWAFAAPAVPQIPVATISPNGLTTTIPIISAIDLRPEAIERVARHIAALTGDADQSYNSYQSTNNNKRVQVRWTKDSQTFEMDIHGEVEFTDDDLDVKSLSAGGSFRISEQTSVDRVYEVKADNAGQLSRTYIENGRAVPMNDDAHRWLALRLPETIRESGTGAEKRVQRILSHGGPDAVVSEIGLIHSDNSKRRYLQEFILHGGLDNAHLRGSMRLAAKIASDGEKRELFTAVAPVFLKDGLRLDLFDSIGTISSDGEHARTLSSVVADDPSNRETLLLAARSAGKIASDAEKSRLLISLADHYRGNEEIRDAWFSSLNTVASDGEKRSALSAVIRQDGNDRETLAEALKSAGRIASDGEKTRFLVESSQYYIEDGAIRRNFFSAVEGIASDGEKRRALSALYRRSNRNAATFKQILHSSQTIGSDGEKASLLEEVAGPLTGDPSVIDDFFSACNSISSDGEHSRVLVRTIQQSGSSTPMLTRVIESATRISSDGEKARVLSQVIAQHPKDAAVRSALRKAIESITSDGESRRLMAAMSSQEGA